MALRVTQSMLYGSSIRGMNRTLNDLMESNLQSSTQKRINRPSDDPSGAGRVIAYRSSLNTLTRYSANIDQATGWLSTIDSTLAGNDGSVQSVLTSISGLSLQGATGTVTEESRDIIASQLEGLLDTLIGLANAKYNGYHVFAGHKTDQPAYVRGLGVDVPNADNTDPTSLGYYNLPDDNTDYFSITGPLDAKMIIQAVGGGAVGTDVYADDATYRYSIDGGATWIDSDSNGDPITATVDAEGQCQIVAGGVTLTCGNAADVRKTVRIVDTTNPHSNDNGTWIHIRPTAIYQGDDNDEAHVLPLYGARAINMENPAAVPPRTATVTNPNGPAGVVQATPSGFYRNPVEIEVLSAATDRIQYRYSTDGGTTWVENSVTGDSSSIPIPGGALSLTGTPKTDDRISITGTLTEPFSDPTFNPDANVNPAGNYPQVEGRFTRDVAVRIDTVDAGQITYSYSLDDGGNWTQATAPITSPATDNRLPVPGGYLNFGNLAPDATSQFNIHPHRADIDLQIGDSSNITVNMVGKDVFGGLYDYHCDGKGLLPVPGPNMFETIGRLIGMADAGSQQGFQEALEDLKGVMTHVTTKAAVAGGREDRLIATKGAITNQIFSQEEGLSAVEDIDVTELLTRLAQQQMAYNSALKSSSMIMQMSLVNFL